MNRGTYRTPRRALAGLVAAVALAAPAQAAAAGAGVGNGTLGIASGNESSAITVTQIAGNLVVADPARSLTAIAPCTNTGSPAKVVCPAGSVTSVIALMGGGDDLLDTSTLSLPVTVDGGSGGDRIVTGSGADVIDGGNGTDVLLARDGRADKVTCGTGPDSGQVDAVDTVSTDCEAAVERPAPPAPNPDAPVDPAAPPAPAPGGAADDTPTPEDGTATGDEDTPDEAADDTADDAGDDTDDTADDDAPVEITTPAALALSPQGDITIAVACTADTGSCRGTIELIESGGTLKARTVVAAARTSSAAKDTLLARTSFTIPAGRKKNVRLRLDRHGRQRIIKKKKKGKTKGRIVITVRAPDGTVTTTEKNVTISPAKERRTSKRGRAPGKKKGSSR